MQRRVHAHRLSPVLWKEVMAYTGPSQEPQQDPAHPVHKCNALHLQAGYAKPVPEKPDNWSDFGDGDLFENPPDYEEVRQLRARARTSKQRMQAPLHYEKEIAVIANAQDVLCLGSPKDCAGEKSWRRPVCNPFEHIPKRKRTAPPPTQEEINQTKEFRRRNKALVKYLLASLARAVWALCERISPAGHFVWSDADESHTISVDIPEHLVSVNGVEKGDPYRIAECKLVSGQLEVRLFPVADYPHRLKAFMNLLKDGGIEFEGRAKREWDPSWVDLEGWRFNTHFLYVNDSTPARTMRTLSKTKIMASEPRKIGDKRKR